MKRWFIACCLICTCFTAIAQETTTNPNTTIHVVQRGETLWGIARNYGVTLESLAILNSLTVTSGIQTGQRLLVPSDELVPTVETTTDTEETQQPAYDTLHVVARGETLFRIALSYGLTVSDLVSANGLTDPELIYAGQQLIIPGSTRLIQGEAPQYAAPIQTLLLRPSPFVEGQTAAISLTTTETATILATFLGTTLPVTSDALGTTHTMLFGIPMFTEAGNYPLSITVQGITARTTLDITIAVINGGYLTTDITLSPDQEALLAPAVEEYEIQTLKNLTSQITPTKYYEGAFGLPAAAAMNAPFGTRRSYNGGAVSRYHNGADFAVAPGNPIFAAANGRVVLTDALNIRGNTVVIDHGWGVYTLYAHLTSINVSLGDTISVGQTIGISGSTGRVTGPHLHWEVWVDGISVDPMQWTQITYP